MKFKYCDEEYTLKKEKDLRVAGSLWKEKKYFSLIFWDDIIKLAKERMKDH